MSDNPIGIRPLSLGFADPVLESAFRAEQARKMIKPIRAACVAGFVMTLLGGALIAKFVPEVRGQLAISMLIVLALFVAYYSATYARHFARTDQIALLVVAYGLGLAYIALSARLTLSPLPAVGLLLLTIHTFSVYSIFPMRFPLGCMAGWGTSAVYLGYLSSIDALQGTQLAGQGAVLVVVNLCGMIASYLNERATRGEFLALRLLGQERERSERLLLNILPVAIAERLKNSPEFIADHSAEVTVLFADIVGFTPLSASKAPQDLVRLLDIIFSEFDALAEKHGLEKIKTIGDAYMAASGLPDKRPDHAPAAAHMAQEMLASVARIALETGEALALRIGLSSGPVVAGVIGRKKFIYDLWGDTVNTASRMESHGLPGMIHCSEATAALLRPAFALTARGAMKIDGKGEMSTYLVRS